MSYEKTSVASLSSDETENSDQSAPDGGFGWVVVASAFCVHMIADGIGFSFGLILAELFDSLEGGHSKISWIGSIFLSCPLLVGPLTAVLIDLTSCRTVTMIGSITATMGFLLTYVVPSRVDVFCFTTGILAGVGLGMCYLPAVIIVSYYFDSRRALATGISVSGSGVGTFLFAPFVRFLIDKYSWRGTILILGGVILHISVAAALFRPLQAQVKQKKPKFRASDILFSNAAADRNHSTTTPANKASQNIPNHMSMMELPTFRLRGSQLLAYRNVLFESHRSIKKHTSECELTTMPYLPVTMEALELSPEVVDKYSLTASCPTLLDYQMSVNDSDKLNFTSRCCDRLTHFIKKKPELNLRLSAVYCLFFISNVLLYFWYDITYLYIPDISVSEANMSKFMTSLAMSLLGILNTLGQLVMGFLGDLNNVSTVLLYSAGLTVTGCVTLLVPTFFLSTLGIFIYVSIYGFFVSVNYSLTTVIIAQYIGIERLHVGYGILTFGQGLANIFGPPVVGYIRETDNDYHRAFLISGIFIALSGAIVLPLHFYKPVKESETTSDAVIEN